ncbi:sulfate adenylyltransferase subunit 1 [Actinomarinicola tropica]|uniref:sulfate adenylyltransferase n=1 Tax=Actinomarinicola tropica TaxID=2789776 RepID=A0A5Q2RNA1_9ACTN|nr:GTP-binding protein [Actinomarinicola tropica]QGG96061.1 sulfate adenylyltransferase [Actinomarinicola tropica]
MGDILDPDVLDADTDLLRFATIGSVDDGKSTLIGRLLHDAKGLLQDQLDAVAASSARRGHEGLDLSLVTDGLRAEREQGITIDVAYRYFATPRRTFIVGDNPGHAQYTRNMATGASTAEVAVVLVDARNGLTTQTRRHVTVAALLGIRQFAVCVNKMDLVDWSEERFDQVVAEILRIAEQLGIDTITPIPLSALHGDNVVDRSGSTPWYSGPTLLEYLETVDPAPVGDHTGGRLPVQLVVREPGEGRPIRRYAGMVHGGPLRPGDPITVLPSGQTTTVAEILVGADPVEVAPPGLSVTVSLTDDLDVIRGDVLAAPEPPMVTREVEATLCWFTEQPFRPGDRWLVKHGTRVERAIAREVVSRLDIEALAHEEDAGELAFNDIGVVRLATAGPLAVDTYDADRVLGSFVVIDERTDHTVGAGMIRAWS